MSGPQDWAAALLLSIEPTDRALAGWDLGQQAGNWLRGMAELAAQAGLDGGPGCACRHPLAAHEHNRAGLDCSLCGCRKFRQPRRKRIR